MARPKKRPIAQHYQLHNGNPVLVLFRKTVLSRTERCPYCCERHLGAIRDGHTLDYCSQVTTFRYIRNCLHEINLTPDEITAADGTILKREHGYFILTKPDTKLQGRTNSTSLNRRESAKQTSQRKRSKTAQERRTK